MALRLQDTTPGRRDKTESLDNIAGSDFPILVREGEIFSDGDITSFVVNEDAVISSLIANDGNDTEVVGGGLTKGYKNIDGQTLKTGTFVSAGKYYLGRSFKSIRVLTGSVTAYVRFGKGVFNPLNYGGLHYWSNTKQSDVGTTITRFDQIGSLDMANPSGASEPTIDGAYLSYDGVSQYLSNAVSNFRSGDNTGVITVKFKATDNTLNQSNVFFGVSSDLSDTEFFQITYSDLKIKIALITSGATVYSLQSTITLSLNSTNILSVYSNGTTIKAILNGVVISIPLLVGTNTGQWFNDFSGSTNQLTFGSSLRLNNTRYGKSNANQVMYSSYIDEQTIIDLHTELALLP